MSHFSVMVICDTVEELETMLAPYQENNMGDCPKQFLEFNDIAEKTYGSAEFYAKSESEFCTYAVIAPDGKWHAKGEMGWFGCSNEDADDAHAWIEHYAETFIEPYADRHAFIVDCHI